MKQRKERERERETKRKSICLPIVVVVDVVDRLPAKEAAEVDAVACGETGFVCLQTMFLPHFCIEFTVCNDMITITHLIPIN